MNRARHLFYLFVLLTSLPALAAGGFKLFRKNISYSSMNLNRDIYVYLPDGYEKSATRYPVIYMHDGQNLFDPARGYLGQTWKAQSTLNELIARKLMSPVIVVAIDNTSARMEEYIPEKQADAYLDFIIGTLKPLVDGQLKTKTDRTHTAIMGSSLGGLVSLYAGIKHPEIFGRVAALSPSIWWNQRSILGSYQQAAVLPLKVYLDSGTEGGEEPQDVQQLTALLQQRGFEQRSLYSFIQNGANHSEYFWAMRLPIALQFLFP
jgi:predicted alpha/beta superfamily hydrolase